MKLNILAAIVFSGLLAACADTPDTPAAQTPGDGADLAGFAGAKAGQAENGLQVRGYNLVRTEGLIGYWYNATNLTCAKIVTSQGLYSSVDVVPLSNCDL
ncbi:MAG: hypothetical protein ABJH07_21330 [Sedimentitalea sp.]|uniref:hypothetical protein n=1 Tax=Sedimentitalea sp. TaxID=2048915 RepID=UPI0032672636